MPCFVYGGNYLFSSKVDSFLYAVPLVIFPDFIAILSEAILPVNQKLPIMHHITYNELTKIISIMPSVESTLLSMK